MRRSSIRNSEYSGCSGVGGQRPSIPITVSQFTNGCFGPARTTPMSCRYALPSINAAPTKTPRMNLIAHSPQIENDGIHAIRRLVSTNGDLDSGKACHRTVILENFQSCFARLASDTVSMSEIFGGSVRRL